MYLLQLSVVLKACSWQNIYPMDYYAYSSLGEWTVNNDSHRPVKNTARTVRGSAPVKSCDIVETLTNTSCTNASKNSNLCASTVENSTETRLRATNINLNSKTCDCSSKLAVTCVTAAGNTDDTTTASYRCQTVEDNSVHVSGSKLISAAKSSELCDSCKCSCTVNENCT